MFVGSNRVSKDNNATIRGAVRGTTCSLERRRVNGNNTAYTQQYAAHQMLPAGQFCLFYRYQIFKQIPNTLLFPQ